ncbi:hypothetical protein, partial [Plesiomonas sp.]|uniref:hypothetical protein n=1 Tax=Plesiomonas sp. TaxID=2486279 RepID=UPI003F3E0F8D
FKKPLHWGFLLGKKRDIGLIVSFCCLDYVSLLLLLNMSADQQTLESGWGTYHTGCQQKAALMQAKVY